MGEDNTKTTSVLDFKTTVTAIKTVQKLHIGFFLKQI